MVKELTPFNLSATGDDVKGLAFERFLGDTFRGELGQFFTPRPIVDFMVDLLNPQEGELVCDPAAGSGGFLIRAFEHVREAISDDVQAKKDAARAAIEAKRLKRTRKSAGSTKPSSNSIAISIPSRRQPAVAPASDPRLASASSAPTPNPAPPAPPR